MRFIPGLVVCTVAAVLHTVPEAAVEPAGFPETVSENGLYLVRLVGEPAATYAGGIPGHPRTMPRPGEKLDPRSAPVVSYAARLHAEHVRVLEAVGIPAEEEIYCYHHTLHGFAAALGPDQRTALRARRDVISVTPDRREHLTTDRSPDFLGLTDPSGGLRTDLGLTGEGVVIGVIDTGIWPEHPSFADDGYGPPPTGWSGSCDPGTTGLPVHCNDKLIGARYFLEGFVAAGFPEGEVLSPRDRDGHGSHTASIAGGNEGVPATILGSSMGHVSGMAPRARIAAYKACSAVPSPQAGDCFTSDLLMAVEAAVADGVDVINYSITGNLFSPIQFAFLSASAAGVFVSASAGNGGPGPATVNHNSPWVTTVGANTQDRTFAASIKVNGKLFDGAPRGHDKKNEAHGVSITRGLGNTDLVDGAAAGSELCIPGELDRNRVRDKIVLCRRGNSARVAKSLAVKEAGGAGMVLYNPSDDQSLLTDLHHVPSIQVDHTTGMALREFIADKRKPKAMIRIHGSRPAVGPVMASFSSRGPASVVPDLIKPDITAPGVQILAAHSPEAQSGAPGQSFQIISGTSMSSPHMAGVAAVIKEAHPDWSPARIKSALMTTAHQGVAKDGETPADPFDMGAGHLNPNPAVDPGLVYDVETTDYTDVAEIFPGGSTPAVDLNLPSLALSRLTAPRIVARRVTNVGAAGRYVASVEAPVGIDVTVDPAHLDLGAPGSGTETATYSVRLSATDDLVDEQWVFGSVTWSDGEHRVRGPLAVRAFSFDAPPAVRGRGTAGSTDFEVVFNYTGDYGTKMQGLVPADEETRTIQQSFTFDPQAAFFCFANTMDPACGVQFHIVSIPPGIELARFALFDEFTSGMDELNLFVLRWPVTNPEQDLIGLSFNPGSTEQVTVASPAPGAYLVGVHAPLVEGGATTDYTLFGWMLDAADAGNTTVSAPAAAVAGTTATVTVAWSGLDGDTKYLGRLVHEIRDGRTRGTLVEVDTYATSASAGQDPPGLVEPFSARPERSREPRVASGRR